MNVLPGISAAIAPFKRLAQPTLGKMLQPSETDTADLLVPYLKAGHVQWRGVDVPDELPLMWASEADVANLHPAPGDLLICEGGEVGRAALAPKDLPNRTVIQNSLHLVRESDTASPRYLRYALAHVASSGWLDLVCSKATIAHLTVDKLRELPVPYWDKPDQERIANFLDDKTTRIDALIAEKERLIERLADFRLLAIRREVLGHTSVGGERHPPPRGEPWMESIPRHWGTPKVKHLLRTTSGSTPSTDKRDVYYDGEIPWIRSLDLPNGLITGAEEHITEAALKDTACKVLPVGTVLLAMYGGDGTIGKSGLLGIEAACNQALCAILPTARVEPRFLHWYMVFRRPYWMVGADGTRKDPNISQDVVREARLPLPPFGEQTEIANRLDAFAGRLDELCLHVEDHIARLREYRSSLISAAVTGQLTV